MTDYIRTIWQTSASSTMPPSPRATTSVTSASSHPPSPPHSSTMATFDRPTSARIKLEPPASPLPHVMDSPATQAQRLARGHTRRDKRKPLDALETSSLLSKRLKTEAPLLDASGEERLRAMEAQLEHLDPESKEAKKKRRLIRNRMSAQLHRERKKAYVGQLEDQLQAKEHQLKALQEQMAAMAVESEHLKQQLVGRHEQQCQLRHQRVQEGHFDQVPVKLEPLVLEQPVVVVPDASPAVDWAACLDDMDEGMVGEDLLCDLDESPLVAYGLGASREEDPATASVAAALAEEQMRQKAQALTQSHNCEMHAAKKNLAMMMAMMFSVTFCGQSEPMANVTSGSNFSSMFHAVPVKELSQMSIASRIVACLEKTSWEDFQDVSSWTASAASAAAAAVVAVSGDKRSRSPASRKPANSPSAASDVTDSGSCDSPKESTDADMSFDTDLIEEFVYPVDEPFAPALADTNWFGADSEEFGQSDVEGDVKRGSESKTTLKPVSMTSRLYEKLTKLWNENNQVLLTVLNGKNEVTRRSVADMSVIRKSISTGALFPTTATAATVAASNDKLLEKNDQSVTFLYPLSAFSEDQRSAAFPRSAASDQVFLEVSCQINGAASSVL
uniref:BZIP domain-containing protein n=1 Tax=Peronospora matthiolae TaxID=2874970 RepID=A0AAV1TF38_9STRA